MLCEWKNLTIKSRGVNLGVKSKALSAWCWYLMKKRARKVKYTCAMGILKRNHEQRVKRNVVLSWKEKGKEIMLRN